MFLSLGCTEREPEWLVDARLDKNPGERFDKAVAAVVAAVASGCCGPVAGRNRTPSRDEAGNDAVAVADGVAAAAADGVVAGAADGGGGGGGAVVVVAAAGVGGGVQRWSPSPNFDSRLLRHRTPRRLRKASQQLLGVVAGADGVAGPQPTNRNRAPFLPFRSASGRPTSCTLLKFQKQNKRKNEI
ncbi:hypothetical protein DAPPUDRAFT_99084 [Daphnia pulex]|uniref:Uncharacterized protein n=1 Tax=Daphnia pulex TaxID=6669 RepID=E9G6P3_DAPPU|nr:hypothetical protein DAPPUDRAFT_99084 [Daphnia pulex]|eukprot:EFX85157.1 hypothetical protein DAPPUDRAFT_99084 [Daphnia pulex]